MGKSVMIMDMDGFSIGGKFYSKELGVRKVGEKEGLSFFRHRCHLK